MKLISIIIGTVLGLGFTVFFLGCLSSIPDERVKGNIFDALNILFLLVALKTIMIGSDFSFYHWIRDGKKYSNWYNNRPKYKDIP